MDRTDPQKPETALETFIEEVIRDFVRTSPLNRLESFGGAPIFTAPLVGFASGEDPLFQTFKQVVHPDHFLPGEILQQATSAAVKDTSVIAFALPIHPETLRSNALQTEGPSLRWNHSRWQGEIFAEALTRNLVAALEGAGGVGLAPALTPLFQVQRPPKPVASTWSQRHIAYAAGLGTFSLCDGFITSKGMGVWCGSVVTDLKLRPSEKPYGHHMANCRHHTTGKCGACVARCPSGALSEEGHDKAKCMEVLFIGQKPWLEGVHGPGYIGKYAGCGLCMTGVPCSDRIPS